jgi:hypothetical protein
MAAVSQVHEEPSPSRPSFSINQANRISGDRRHHHLKREQPRHHHRRRYIRRHCCAEPEHCLAHGLGRLQVHCAALCRQYAHPAQEKSPAGSRQRSGPRCVPGQTAAHSPRSSPPCDSQILKPNGHTQAAGSEDAAASPSARQLSQRLPCPAPATSRSQAWHGDSPQPAPCRRPADAAAETDAWAADTRQSRAQCWGQSRRRQTTTDCSRSSLAPSPSQSCHTSSTRRTGRADSPRSCPISTCTRSQASSSSSRCRTGPRSDLRHHTATRCCPAPARCTSCRWRPDRSTPGCCCRSSSVSPPSADAASAVSA